MTPMKIMTLGFDARHNGGMIAARAVNPSTSVTYENHFVEYGLSVVSFCLAAIAAGAFFLHFQPWQSGLLDMLWVGFVTAWIFIDILAGMLILLQLSWDRLCALLRWNE